MLNANDMANILVATNLKNSAATYKRLAGSLRSFKTSHITGLDTVERKKIADAIALVEEAASRLKKALVVKTKSEEQRERNLHFVKQKVKQSNFGKISNVAEKVAFLHFMRNDFALSTAGQSPYMASHAMIECFNEQLDWMAHNLVKDVEDVDAKLDEAWRKFQEVMPAISTDHAKLILRIQELFDTVAVHPHRQN